MLGIRLGGEREPSWLMWVALIVISAWLAFTLLMPTIHQGIGPFAALQESVQDYFGSKTTLGETGDFLTGWLTPLALMWFVITVFLQKRELALQRQEFVAMRKEWEGSKEAAEQQADQLKQSNNVRERQLFREVLLDTIAMMPRACEHVADAYNTLCRYI